MPPEICAFGDSLRIVVGDADPPCLPRDSSIPVYSRRSRANLKFPLTIPNQR